MSDRRHTEDLRRPLKLKAAKALQETALSYPETHDDHPWGERACKVSGKGFLSVLALGATSEPRMASGFDATMTLPSRSAEALEEPWTEPTGYGIAAWASAGGCRCGFPRGSSLRSRA